MLPLYYLLLLQPRAVEPEPEPPQGGSGVWATGARIRPSWRDEEERRRREEREEAEAAAEAAAALARAMDRRRRQVQQLVICGALGGL